VPGKSGQALEFDKNSGVDLSAPLDLRDKSFTLAAWVLVKQFGGNGACTLFGGAAPDGAGQDGTGYVLHVGLKAKKPFAGFFGADLKGEHAVEPAVTERGSDKFVKTTLKPGSGDAMLPRTTTTPKHGTHFRVSEPCHRLRFDKPRGSIVPASVVSEPCRRFATEVSDHQVSQ